MGREFDQLFDTWAESYDDTVAGVDIEYKEVFYRYEEILNSVAEKVSGTVMEFGVGTGNLTQKLVKRNVKVIGIEPSQNMRKIAKEKIKNIDLHDGDFLNFPIPRKPLDAIVTTYAFHHLNDEEKFQAIEKYVPLLTRHGKIVIADTIFLTEEDKMNSIVDAENKGFYRLANDLKTEYYTTIPVIATIFEKLGFTVTFSRFNFFVWVIEAKKL